MGQYVSDGGRKPACKENSLTTVGEGDNDVTTTTRSQGGDT